MRHQIGFTLRFGAWLAFMFVFPSEAAVVVKPITYEGFQDALHVSNESTELVIVPSIGRILHYGFKKGINALWECKPRNGPVWKVGNWSNWGGDKIWIWPQDIWLTRSGKSWPPPGDGTDQTWQAEILENKVRLSGPEFEGFECRAIREIQLAEIGSTVTLTTQMRSEGSSAARDVAPWSVTQVPSTGRFYARLADGATAVSPSSDGWPEPKRVGNVLCFSRDGSRNSKSFLDADVLAVEQGSQLFVQSLISSDTLQSKYLPRERAQIYSSPDQDKLRPEALRPYVELEFTAPRSGESGNSVLIVKWSLLRLQDEKHSTEEIARCLNALSK